MAGISRLSGAARSLSRRIAAAPPSRSFAAAAAVEYDTEWEDEEERWRRSPPARPAAAAWGEMGRGGVQWVFMGNPGPQKRACASRVAELLEVPYISMGTLVRQELHPRSALYMKIASAVNEGGLVHEDIVFGLLSKRLEEGYARGEAGFILDGIPRTRIQAEMLDQIADIDLVVNFKCLADCFLKKQFGKNVCFHCGKSFDLSCTESTSANPCLGTRTRHSRVESSAATEIAESRVDKFRSYAEQNELLEDYYRQQNKLINFQVSGGPGETWQGLLAALHLKHVDAAYSSPKLTI